MMKIIYPVLTALAAAWISSSAQACAPVPPAVIDIDANSYYNDNNHSVIDPARRARNIEATRPIEDFLGRVAGERDAACALAWLADWAGHKALLGKLSSEQAWYVRKWTLGGMALSYARLRPSASAAQRQAIEDWFKALADGTIAHAEAHKGKRNNHYYWEGLAVTAVGGVTGEARYLDWGRKVFDHAMGQVAPDGSLPAEMERGAKALHYHVFAATPLVMMASILDLHAPALDRLVGFTLAAVADPSGIGQATGVAQEKVADLPFAAIYARHEGRAELMPARVKWQARLGGDVLTANPLEHPGGAKAQ